MKMLSYLIVSILMALALTSCEREINIDLGDIPDQIVVEGTIEPGGNPKVLVTRNRDFFENYPTDLLSLLDTFIIQDAIVSINDGNGSVPMLFVVNPFEYPYAYYTTTAITGIVGGTYTISVEARNQTLTAHTTIPPAVAVDSTWFSLNFFNVDEDSLGFLNVAFTDPDTFGNAYRLYSKRNSETEYFPVTGSLANDEFINARYVNFFAGQAEKPFGNQDTFINDNFFYSLGDTIFVKFYSIGRREFDFYNTYEAASASNGNPFASPTLIKSNVEGGMGIWCGQSFFYDTLIVN